MSWFFCCFPILSTGYLYLCKCSNIKIHADGHGKETCKRQTKIEIETETHREKNILNNRSKRRESDVICVYWLGSSKQNENKIFRKRRRRIRSIILILVTDTTTNGMCKVLNTVLKSIDCGKKIKEEAKKKVKRALNQSKQKRVWTVLLLCVSVFETNGNLHSTKKKKQKRSIIITK